MARYRGRHRASDAPIEWTCHYWVVTDNGPQRVEVRVRGVFRDYYRS